MFHFLRYRSLFHFNNNIIPALNIQFLQYPFRECHSGTGHPSSVVEYLRDSLGFSPERALTISKQLKCKIKNPALVPTFLQSHGFSKAHVQTIIRKYPCVLYYSFPESKLTPKIEFFREKGLSESDVVGLIVSNPVLLVLSLERSVKPLFDFAHSILGRDAFVVEFLSRVWTQRNPDLLSTNMAILRNCGVSDKNISRVIRRYPKVIEMKPNRLKEILDMVKGMGFNPFLTSFTEAVITIAGLSSLSWDMKLKVYKSMGWSDEEILYAFRKNPCSMRISEGKIKKVMDYFTKELGWDHSCISMHPQVLSLSLEKRIIPRHRFLQFLFLKGFIKKYKISFGNFLIGEKRFLAVYVMRYQLEVPHILKIYEGFAI